MAGIGIDFGTTNSAIAVFSGGSCEVLDIDDPREASWSAAGFARLFPSVFGVDEAGNTLFGWDAKLRSSQRIEAVKRLFATEDEVMLGDRSFLVEEIAASLFGKLRQSALAQGVDASRAVVTIPANSRGLARYRTKICAGLAGIEVGALLNEPTAAAMAFGLKVGGDGQRILVVDWGGGTLDVTLLETQSQVFVEHASKGIQRLGGRDFDRQLLRHLLGGDTMPDSWDAKQRADFELELEMAKIRLSSQDAASVAYPDGRRVDLSRAQFNQIVGPLVDRVVEPIETCLREVGIAGTGVDHLLLVGGTCLIPAIRDRVASIVGIAPSPGASPLTAVAEGAAVASAILNGEHDADFVVSTEHALGTVVRDGAGVQKFAEIIPRNHKLPVERHDFFVPANDYQEQVRIEVVEGDPSKSIGHEDNVTLRDWVIDLPGRPTSEAGFKLTYRYDTNGIIHVSAVDELTGNEMMSADVSFVTSRQPSELVELRNRVEDHLDDSAPTVSAAPGSAALPADVVELLARARVKVIPFVPEDEAATIGQAASTLEAAASRGEYRAEYDALDQMLRKHAYLY